MSEGSHPRAPASAAGPHPTRAPKVPEDVDVLRRRLCEAQEERARLWEEVQRLRAERRAVEYYERVAQEMRASASWKLTAPLRAAKTLAIRVERARDKRRA